MEIVDDVMIPAGLAAGEYVLSWRYDTESTSQVWWVRLLLCTPFLSRHRKLNASLLDQVELRRRHHRQTGLKSGCRVSLR